MKKIAIIGSTGMMGQPVTKEFIKAGFEVSLLVRNAAKGMEMFGNGVRFVTGDLQDMASLRELLKGQDAVYLNLSIDLNSKKNDFQAERDGLKNILTVAKETSIKRIGYLSSLVHLIQGMDWWVLDVRRNAVTEIKQCGIPYSIFYPSTFMESFDKGGYRQGNNLNLIGVSRYPMYLISGSDYGKQVVKTFEIATGNTEYVVQGQEGFKFNEAAKLFVENYTKEPIKIAKIPRFIFVILGKFSPRLNYAINIVDALNNYPEKFEAEKTWQDLGVPQTKFIDYIRSA
jgi:hypothetical protein